MRILVTDGDNRSSLAVTRSLGSKGYTVYVSSTDSKSLAASSRYCTKGISVPDPLHDGKAYVENLLVTLQQEEIDIVFPMTEQTIYLLNPVRPIMPNNVILACPPQQTMFAVSDKSELFKLAENLQITVPRTYHLKGEEDLSYVLQQIEEYPVVVKPALSRVPVKNGFVSAGVKYAMNAEELRAIYALFPMKNHPSLIQEKIVGPGTGLFTLYNTREHLALFSHKRLREKPPSGGVSVVCESVAIDKAMAEASGKLLSAVNFDGVAMVEFKRDLRDGKAKLMEINGRFWGSLQLAVTSGVDFPALYLDYLMGQKVSHTLCEYSVGHKVKWFLGTLDHLIIRVKTPERDKSILGSFQSKTGAFYDFLKIRNRKTSFDVFRLRDIAPFLCECKSYIKAILRRK